MTQQVVIEEIRILRDEVAAARRHYGKQGWELVVALKDAEADLRKLKHDLERMRVELVRVDRLRREAERRIPTGDGIPQ